MNSRRTTLYAFMLFSAGGALAQDSPFGFWKFLGTIDLEKTRTGAGVVFRFRYVAANADIFFFDAGKHWDSGLDDSKMSALLEQTKRELAQAAEQGIYRNMELGPAEEIVISGQPFHLQRMTFWRTGSKQVSLTYTTGLRGKLLKYRITVPEVVSSIGTSNALFEQSGE